SAVTRSLAASAASPASRRASGLGSPPARIRLQPATSADRPANSADRLMVLAPHAPRRGPLGFLRDAAYVARPHASPGPRRSGLRSCPGLPLSCMPAPYRTTAAARILHDAPGGAHPRKGALPRLEETRVVLGLEGEPFDIDLGPLGR